VCRKVEASHGAACRAERTSAVAANRLIDEVLRMSAKIALLLWSSPAARRRVSPASQLWKSVQISQSSTAPPETMPLKVEMVSEACRASTPIPTIAVAWVNAKAADGGVTHQWHYTVTEQFIRGQLRGKFAQNSLVCMDSCTGATAAVAWAQAGVARYASWSDVATDQSIFAWERLFDRMAGTNDSDPVSTPAERPFAIDDVLPWMQQNGYDHHTAPLDDGGTVETYLQVFTGPSGDFGILRPTIARVLNTASASPSGPLRLTLEGSFGSDLGASKRRVTYGGQPLAVDSWANDQIIAQMPEPPPSGNVQVVIGNHQSEEVPLTEWDIPFTYAWTGQGTLQYTILLECRLRADLRGMRVQPGQTPAAPMTATWNLQDSGGSLTASGSLFSDGTLVESWSGGSTLTWVPPGGIPTNYVICDGFVDGTKAAIANFAPIGGGSFTITRQGGSTSTGNRSTAGVPIPVQIPIDWPSLTVLAGSVPVTGDLGQYGVSATLSWPDAQPVHAPTDSDRR